MERGWAAARVQRAWSEQGHQEEEEGDEARTSGVRTAQLPPPTALNRAAERGHLSVQRSAAFRGHRRRTFALRPVASRFWPKSAPMVGVGRGGAGFSAEYARRRDLFPPRAGLARPLLWQAQPVGARRPKRP